MTEIYFWSKWRFGNHKRWKLDIYCSRIRKWTNESNMEYFAHLENWNGVWIGLDGELNFPYGNGILYCYENLPEKFNKEMYWCNKIL